MNLLQEVTALIPALGGDPQSRRLLRLDFPNGDGPASVMLANALVADEALSSDFSFEVEVLSDDALIPLKDVMGKMVTISLVRDDGTLRYFNGYVFAFGVDRTDGGLAFYHMVLKPWLAFLRLKGDCRVFQNVTLTELCDLMFQNYLQRDYKYHLIDETPSMTLAVQYNETDHNHLHRRLEAAGLHYWYEHRADGHTLCIGDDSTLAQPIAGTGEIAYQSQSGSLEDDGIRHWRPIRQISSGKVSLNSYNFKNARSDRTERPSGNHQGAVDTYEVYQDMGAYGFKDDDAGEQLAARRMEVVDSGGQDFAAESNERNVQPGQSFTLSGHFSGGHSASPVDGQPASDKAGREYLIVSAHHEASNNYHDGQGNVSHYTNFFTCLRKSTRWRPQLGAQSRDTRIYGLQTATVVGPKGEDIHTDKYGRVRVQFHWDREGKSDDKSSPWVRVMTTAAGSGFGHISVPRIGQEVVVQFLDGNCDRPLIIGSVYNAANMPPWELPANKTQSGIATRSTIGGKAANANALRFEDLKGAEELWLHAERDQRIEVEHDESHSVGNDRRKTIDHDETVEVKHDRTETVGNDEKITVRNCRSERVDQNEHIDIGGERTKKVGQNETVVIGMTKTERVGLNKEETIQVAKTLTVGGAYAVTVGGGVVTSVAGSQFDNVGQDHSTSVGKSCSINAGDSFEIRVGSASFKMTANGAITITGSSIDISASGPVHINGKDVDIN